MKGWLAAPAIVSGVPLSIVDPAHPPAVLRTPFHTKIDGAASPNTLQNTVPNIN